MDSNDSCNDLFLPDYSPCELVKYDSNAPACCLCVMEWISVNLSFPSPSLCPTLRVRVDWRDTSSVPQPGSHGATHSRSAMHTLLPEITWALTLCGAAPSPGAPTAADVAQLRPHLLSLLRLFSLCKSP